MQDTQLAEIKEYIHQEKFKKYFILTGKNSFYKSGASKIFEKIINKKNYKIYFKKEFIPKLKELRKRDPFIYK